ncbi:helix-turn-helix transcriptional regulator [Herpetosiphon llansteffanensis]|uniref:helix-turn-helix transcriptional regulator n=1 Tax=Herpetosiphon llansteffanensis TaxID=2094568 RepID=UPI000D7BE0C4|nr:WYL domain-containing protein [Herpetosiphon llansteffanensis]
MDLLAAEVPSLIWRLIELRDLLLAQQHSFESVCQALSNTYPAGQSGQRAFRRDLHSLRAFGYQIEVANKPKRWKISTNQYVLADDDLEALMAIRDLFGAGHPMTPQVKQFVARLTSNLSPTQQTAWKRRPALRVAFNPAIDYTPYAQWIRFFSDAISLRQQVSFSYRSLSSDQPQLHPRVDPYELEYRDRHYYLLAYCYRYGMILTFRLDRMIFDVAKDSPRLLPDMQHMRRERRKIHFTYRLPAAFASGGVSERFMIEAIRYVDDEIEIDASEFSEFQIIRILLGYGEHARLIKGPESLFAQLRRVIGAMYAHYHPNSTQATSE